MKTDTLIIGAGPAGLAAAAKLAEAGREFLVVEKSGAVGGLARTYIFEEEIASPRLRSGLAMTGVGVVIASPRGAKQSLHTLTFRTDNGPHRFFSKNNQLYEFISDLLKEQWLEVPRQTRQFIGGKFYHYPVRPAQALANIGPHRAARMAFDYLIAQWQFAVLQKEILNFEDYIIANFGRALGRFNIINYTEKIWGIPANTIHSDWAKQRIKGLSVAFLAKIAIQGALKNFRAEELRTLANTFYYPEYGTGLIYEKIAEQLRKQNYQILFNTQPVKIKHKDNKIIEVVLETKEIASSPRGAPRNDGAGESVIASRSEAISVTDGKIAASSTTAVGTPRNDDASVIARSETTKQSYVSSFEFQVSDLIESIPIDDFLRLLDPPPPSEIMVAAEKIKYRDQVYLFLTLDKDRITKDQWIYFPEKNIPFGRISEMKNFSQKMSPPGKTSLLVEYFCFKNDEIWNKSKDELMALTVGYLERLGFCSAKEIRNSYLFRREKVYPVYDTHYKEYLAVIKNYLDRFENLYYIGRPGRFRYNNQDHSLEMGFLAARSVIEGKKYDIEAVGAEMEYYESNSPTRQLANSLTRQPANSLTQFIGYAIAAAIATVVDVSILYYLTEFANVWYFYSAAIGYGGGIVTNYILGRIFVFRNHSRAIARQFGLYAAIASVGLAINQIAIYTLVEFAGFWYIPAKLVAVAIATAWSFWGHKNFTFKIYQ